MDLYDARIGGGFPKPVAEASCSGEPCQGSPTGQPAFGSAPSSTSPAGGNLTAPLGAVLTFKTTQAKAKPLTNAQKLTKALKACAKKRNKTQRLACRRQATKKYSSKAKPKKTKRKGR